MGSNSTKVTQGPTFTQFPLLPPELRNKIWEDIMFDVEPNVIYASTEVSLPSLPGKINPTKGLTEPRLRAQCTKSSPTILAVNRESRSIALRTHRPLAPGIPLFLNPTTDLIFLQDSAVIDNFNIAGRHISSSFDLASAVVAVNLGHLAIGVPALSFPSHFCSKLASLKTLTLVQSKSRRRPRRGPPTDESLEEILTRTCLLSLWAIQRLSLALGRLVEPTIEQQDALITQAGASTVFEYSEQLNREVRSIYMPDASKDTSKTTVKYLNAETMQGLAEGRVGWPICNIEHIDKAAYGS